ncbi:MAG: SDR family NAD(P)-dependent oxidoreductase [Pseudomonadota bacterium]|nr:SDR family NAD(P)-dependent oxidoreductase [Pseudomonadota bacterium]
MAIARQSLSSTSKSEMGALRRLLVRAPFAAAADLRGKQALVTGAAPGSIGYETARSLAAWGADVIITTRSDPARVVDQLRAQLASSPGHGNVHAHALDLSDRQSVETFAAWLQATHGQRLDLLINNAGIHLDLLSQWKSPKLSNDGHELHWRTNYLGTMQLTLRLLPLLQATGLATGDARVVNVVSMLHSKGSNAALFEPAQPYNSWTAYGTSKLALIHATTELQRRHFGSHHLQAYCLHPGAVYTNIADKGLSGNPRLEAIRRFFAPVERFFLLSPLEGAQTTLHCATAKQARGGLYYRNCAVSPSSPDSTDAFVAARLWAQTEAWL